MESTRAAVGAALAAVLLLSSGEMGLALRLPSLTNPLASVAGPRTIDLRSDTVTRPSEAMRKAMYEAEVGDDVFGDDPTVIALEKRVATMFDKEAALFFPSGTMSNLAATMCWCPGRGAEMILGQHSHMFLYEQGGAAQIAGVSPMALPNEADGTIELSVVERAIRADNIHFPRTSLIAIENTHNFCGGSVLPAGYVESLASLAKCRGLAIPVHMDGARIWNAATASRQPVAAITKGTDSISVCLSKGLGAPAGSLLVGPASLVAEARRVRKVLGGGMRQVGVLAAAGMVALNDFEGGILDKDHARARRIGELISDLPGIHVDVDSIQTNIVLIDIDADAVDTSQIAALLRERRVLTLPVGPQRLRLVTHRDVSDEDVVAVAAAFKDVTYNMWPRPVAEAKTVGEATLSRQVASDAASASAVSSAAIIAPPIEEAAAADYEGGSDGADGADSSLFEESDMIMEQIIVDSTDRPSINATYEEGPSAVYYEETVVHGMSVSPEGFCVFLRGAVCDRVFKILVTPLDPMADGLDRDNVETSEAVTLLQLLQGIDVETHLPRNALEAKFAEADGGRSRYVLRRVMIDSCPNAKTFSGVLCGSLKGSELSVASVESYGKEIPEPRDSDDNSSKKPAPEPPRISPASILSDLLPPLLDSTGGGPAAEPPLPVVQRIDREVSVLSAFEAIALALRHHAVIEVRSAFMLDTDLSYSLSELQAEFPRLLEATSTSDSASRFSEDYDSRSEMDRLQRQLFEAIRQGNEDKIDKIKRQLEFYSNIEGRSVLVPPPVMPPLVPPTSNFASND